GLMQDDYTLFGAFATWDSPDYKWQVRAGVRNLTDELYKTEGQEFTSVANIQTVYYGLPRNYYLSVRYNFFLAPATKRSSKQRRVPGRAPPLRYPEPMHPRTAGSQA